MTAARRLRTVCGVTSPRGLRSGVATAHANFGAATVANDVVFTSDFTGKDYAYSTANGKLLWTAQAPAGINAFPAVTQKLLLVGAGIPGLGTIKKPVFSLVAYGI